MGRGCPTGMVAVLVVAASAVGCAADGDGDREDSAASSAASHEDTCPVSANSRRILADFAFSSEHALEVETLNSGAGFAW
jgi:hypothetical protein